MLAQTADGNVLPSLFSCIAHRGITIGSPLDTRLGNPQRPSRRREKYKSFLQSVRNNSVVYLQLNLCTRVKNYDIYEKKNVYCAAGKEKVHISKSISWLTARINGPLPAVISSAS